ncbi:MAG TPA: signal peptidase II [Actinomycetota bacterium]|nr:signal peptidase II [Actinomycetota bacterium]
MQEGRRAQVAASPKLALLAIALAVIAADQVSKSWAVSALSGGRRIPIIGNTFDLRLVLNPGSAFGFFPGATLVIATLSALVTIAVIIWAIRDPKPPPALGLVIGGGVGNLIDRAFRAPGWGRGHVVDFLYLSFWPTFNLADAAISVGVALLLFQALREERS